MDDLDVSQLCELVKKLQNSNVKLQEEIGVLKKKNAELVEKRNKYLDELGFDILKYFNKYKSIKETAEKYDMTIEEVVDWIPYWDGCSDRLRTAKDYNDYVNDEEDSVADEDSVDEDSVDEDSDDSNDSDEEDRSDYCQFCKENEIEYRCSECETKICYPCRIRCIECMESMCPNCNNENQLCYKCVET